MNFYYTNLSTDIVNCRTERRLDFFVIAQATRATHQIALVVQMNEQDQIANQCEYRTRSEQPVQKGREEEADADDLQLFID